jgi:hypothetical protein
MGMVRLNKEVKLTKCDVLPDEEGSTFVSSTIGELIG